MLTFFAFITFTYSTQIINIQQKKQLYIIKNIIDTVQWNNRATNLTQIVSLLQSNEHLMVKLLSLLSERICIEFIRSLTCEKYILINTNKFKQPNVKQFKFNVEIVEVKKSKESFTF